MIVAKVSGSQLFLGVIAQSCPSSLSTGCSSVTRNVLDCKSEILACLSPVKLCWTKSIGLVLLFLVQFPLKICVFCSFSFWKYFCLFLGSIFDSISQTAAWLRAEAHWESLSYMRSISFSDMNCLFLMFPRRFIKLHPMLLTCTHVQLKHVVVHVRF